MGEETQRRLSELIAKGVRWEEVLKAARDGDVGPLVHHHLQTLNGEIELPDGFRSRLRLDYMETTARNIVFQGELVKLLKVLGEAGIDVIALKGMALVNGVYPKVGLRPMGDLDLLIHREDLERIEALAEPLGYGPDEAEDLQEGYSREFRSEITLIRRGNAPIRIELHWQLLNFGDERETLKGVWESATTQLFDGVEAKVLGPEHLVIYLAEHLAYHHNLDGLLRYCDVAEVLRHYRDEIDWPRLTALARRGRSLLAVTAVLRRAAETLDAPIPPEAMAELEAARPSGFDRLFYRLATNENLATTARALMDFAAIQGVGRRTRFVMGKFFPSRECLMRRWPVRNPALIYAYYPLRWGEMAWRGVRGVGQLGRFLLRRRG